MLNWVMSISKIDLYSIYRVVNGIIRKLGKRRISN